MTLDFMKMKLDEAGPSEKELKFLQLKYDRNPAAFARAYELLLKELAVLSSYEVAIRKNILHQSSESYVKILSSIAGEFLSPNQAALARAGMSLIEALGSESIVRAPKT